MDEKSCPICKSDATFSLANSVEEGEPIDCPTCGSFRLSHSAQIKLGNISRGDYRSAVLSYCIRRMQSSQSGKHAEVSEDLLIDFLKRDLPTATEQVDNLILWLGDNTQPGHHQTLSPQFYPIIGANYKAGLSWVTQSARAAHLLDDTGGSLVNICLSFDGWRRYSELKKGRSDNKRAFMAMQFGVQKLERVYGIFKDAVRLTGFNLMHLDEKPKAGLIDNRLRVEIQISRFLVVDLTLGNRGAYWEGGFAEGLGKPVFYTCKKSYFTHKDKGIHFDANHLYTVL